MAQYLLAMLARDPTGRRAEPFSDLFGQGGRWGDYVFNQEGSFSYLYNIIILTPHSS